MSEKQRPNCVGKGRTLAREAIATIGGLKEASKLSAEAQDKIGGLLTERASAWEGILKMPFIGTVKAGELSWDLNELANELKAAAGAGDEAKSLEIANNMASEIDKYINTTKTFVVRMT
jgi:hypothetical protein